MTKSKPRTIYLWPDTRKALASTPTTLREMLGVDPTGSPAVTTVRLTDEELAQVTEGGKYDFSATANLRILRALKDRV